MPSEARAAPGIQVGSARKEVRCGVCNDIVAGWGSHIHAEIARITETEPAWLPAALRAEALGEYTFHCERCNSFPSMKWPANGGAHSAMIMILIRSAPEAAPLVRREPVVVDMSKARDAVFALAYAPASNDAQVRAAVSNMVHLSGQPPLASIFHAAGVCA